MTVYINVAYQQIKGTSQIARKAGIRDYLEVEGRYLLAQPQKIPIWCRFRVGDYITFLDFGMLTVLKPSEDS